MRDQFDVGLYQGLTQQQLQDTDIENALEIIKEQMGVQALTGIDVQAFEKYFPNVAEGQVQGIACGV